MIDLEYEKTKHLTTEQRSMILDFASQAASDGGLIHYFIFERAIYVFAAQVLYPEKKEIISEAIGKGYDIRLAFDKIVEDGIAEDMNDKYKQDVDSLLDEGKSWCKECYDYEHSARGLLDTATAYSGDIVKAAAERLQEAASGDVQVVERFAKNWGFNEMLDAVKKTNLEVVE